MDNKFNKAIKNINQVIDELKENGLPDDKRLGIDAKTKNAQYIIKIKDKLDEVSRIVFELSKEGKENIDGNVGEYIKVLEDIKSSIQKLDLKYRYSNNDNIEFLQKDVDDRIEKMKDKLAQTDREQALARSEKIAEEIKKEIERLNEKEGKIENQTNFPQFAKLHLSETNPSRLGQLTDRFYNLARAYKKLSAEDNLKINDLDTVIEELLNIDLPEVIFEEDVEDMKKFNGSREMLLAQFKTKEEQEEYKARYSKYFNENGDYTGNLSDKIPMDKAVIDIYDLINTVESFKQVETIKGLVDRYFKTYDCKGISNGENLKKYLKQLQVLTETLIQKDFELGKQFYGSLYRKSLEYIGIDFSHYSYKYNNDDLEQLYKDICKQITDFSKNLEESGYNISVDGDYDIYLRYFINNVVAKEVDLPASPSNHPDEVIARIDMIKERESGEGDGKWYTIYATNREEEQKVIRTKTEAAKDKLSPKIDKEKLAEKITPYEIEQFEEKYSLQAVQNPGDIWNQVNNILNLYKCDNTPQNAKKLIIFEQMIEKQGVNPNEFYEIMSNLHDSKLSSELYKNIDISTISFASLLKEAKLVLDITKEQESESIQELEPEDQNTISSVEMTEPEEDINYVVKEDTNYTIQPEITSNRIIVPPGRFDARGVVEPDSATEFFKSAEESTAREDAVPIKTKWREKIKEILEKVAQKVKETFFR